VQPLPWTEGKGDGTAADMDSYAARISDTDIWNLVNYLRTLAAKL
jgi:mono/diheme cytochrome c family protein